MNALMIYPEFPDTFWSFKHALKFLGKRAAQPPLGLMTVAALLPKAWKKRLVDTNVERLRDRDLAWADVALISAMHIQRDSLAAIVEPGQLGGTRHLSAAQFAHRRSVAGQIEIDGIGAEASQPRPNLGQATSARQEQLVDDLALGRPRRAAADNLPHHAFGGRLLHGQQPDA